MAAALAPQTTNGLTVAIGPLAATLDQAGFDAVSYDLIGEMTEAGTLTKAWNTASYTPYSGAGGSRATVELKTSYARTAVTINVALFDSDAGQNAAEAANELDTCFSIRYTRQDGAIIYFSAQVTQFDKGFPLDAFETAAITLLPQSDGIKVAAP